MAALMVGGAVLGAVFNVLFEKMASPEVVAFFRRKKLNDALLEKLTWKLNTIGGVLDDAEQKQISNHFVKKWLDGLRNAAYEADDLLDEIAYNALQMEVEAGSQGQTSTDQKRKFPSSLIPPRFPSRLNRRRRKLEKRLEKILKALDVLLQEMDHLGFEKGEGVKPYTQKLPPATSLVDESGVYGRYKDRDAIIELLLSDTDASSKYPGVIPIVGMGGVGKTTLAQLVYNDARVREQFELRAWVCVSEEMDSRKLAKDILKEMGFSDCDTMTANGLHCKLEEELKKKKILLVPDDVWSENEAEWESCLMPFKSVKGGSKIVVTTRSEKVASVKSTVPSYPLQELSAEDCWDLFVHHAFGGETSGVDDHDLIAIGRKLVEKCKGLPLAVKALGSQLRRCKDVEVWERMLRSNLWDVKDDKILPALRLSYYSLPSYLKQCFAYCSVFPKDYEFEKERLILLWMAEGFIVQPRGSNKEMAEIGDDYFEELVSTSFFQPSSTDSPSFVMHDLMHDLAESVLEFSLRLEDEKSGNPSKTTRHLSINRYNVETQVKLESIQEAFGLRTLLLSRCIQTPADVLDFVVKLRCLRVLSLPWISELRELPDSIGELKHLRFLDLSECLIETLPEAVTNLYNLQTLILTRCWSVGQLPDSIGKLKQLQYLDLCGTQIQNLPESISSLSNLQKLILSEDGFRETNLNAMPSDMGKLRKLKVLTDYVVGEGSGKGIEELWKLQELQESLRIWNLENVLDDFGVILMGMKYLKRLELHWKGFAPNSKHVLEQLRPHANLKRLVISGYGGASFPSWVGDSCFSNMVSLKLIGCTNCSSFPPLGLKELELAYFPQVKTVGPEFYGSDTSNPFRALERLTIRNMEQWNEWVYEAEKYEGSAFPSLQELVIENVLI